MRTPRMMAAAMIFAMALGAARAAGPLPVEIKKTEGKDEYAVTIGGKPFTAYCYNDKEFREKPVFFPVNSPRGVAVNRMFPIVKGIEGEATDHPHHQGSWFTMDEVNGVKFWNYMPGAKRRIRGKEASIEGATLNTTQEWINLQEKPILREQKSVTFGGFDDVFYMDHDITLTALDEPVTFGDTKEGAFAIRLAPSLQEQAGGKGRYVNAQGLELEKGVWGQQSEWCAITGPTADGAETTVAIFVHPSTVNFPPHWHARGYGCFAVNPFGRKQYEKDRKTNPNPAAEELTTKLEPGQSVHLRFRLAVYASAAGKDRLTQDYAVFNAPGGK